MKQTRRLTLCAMMTAVSVVLMLLGTVLGLGLYAAPLLTGLVQIPVGKTYGRKQQTMVWIATSVLCFLLVPDLEQNLMYAGLFGWYPIVYPTLQRFPRGLRLGVKLVVLNGAMLGIEALVLLFVAPEAMEPWLMGTMLVLWNVVFLLYDIVLPKTEYLLRRLMKLF